MTSEIAIKFKLEKSVTIQHRTKERDVYDTHRVYYWNMVRDHWNFYDARGLLLVQIPQATSALGVVNGLRPDVVFVNKEGITSEHETFVYDGERYEREIAYINAPASVDLEKFRLMDSNPKEAIKILSLIEDRKFQPKPEVTESLVAKKAFIEEADRRRQEARAKEEALEVQDSTSKLWALPQINIQDVYLPYRHLFSQEARAALDVRVPEWFAAQGDLHPMGMFRHADESSIATRFGIEHFKESKIYDSAKELAKYINQLVDLGYVKGSHKHPLVLRIHDKMNGEIQKYSLISILSISEAGLKDCEIIHSKYCLEHRY